MQLLVHLAGWAICVLRESEELLLSQAIAGILLVTPLPLEAHRVHGTALAHAVVL